MLRRVESVTSAQPPFATTRYQPLSPPCGAELARLAECIAVQLHTLIEPLPLQTLFPTRQPLEIDLGCGDGTFLVGEAARRPHHNFLGIERLQARIQKSCRKAARLRLSNVRVLLIESNYLVRFLLPQACVHILHILFPDPWPKRRHAHHRLLQPPFFESATRALAEEGQIRLITDDAPYFHQAVSAANTCAGLKQITPFPADSQRTITTFERRFLEQGKTIHCACWSKITSTPEAESE